MAAAAAGGSALPLLPELEVCASSLCMMSALPSLPDVAAAAFLDAAYLVLSLRLVKGAIAAAIAAAISPLLSIVLDLSCAQKRIRPFGDLFSPRTWPVLGISGR